MAKIFLAGVKQTAENSIQTFQHIITLRNRLKRNSITLLGKKTKTAQLFLNYLYTQPVVDSADVVAALQVNMSTAIRIIEDFVRLNILTETTGYKRNRIYAFKEYIDLFSS